MNVDIVSFFFVCFFFIFPPKVFSHWLPEAGQVGEPPPNSPDGSRQLFG